MDNIILNPEQEKVVEAALKFLKDDSRQIFQFDGFARHRQIACSS